MSHSPGPWNEATGTAAKYGAVVSQTAPHKDAIYDEAYGGYLIAESVSKRDRPIIAAAPDLKESLQNLVAWYGKRAQQEWRTDGSDALLPVDQQPPELRAAMLLLERIGEPVQTEGTPVGFDRSQPVARVSPRDYFIAHAPHHPQPWFKPVMTVCPPTKSSSEIEAEWLRREVERVLADMVDPETEQAKAWIREYHEAAAAVEAWKEERDRQRYLQWPGAWADAMLAAREGKHG